MTSCLPATGGGTRALGYGHVTDVEGGACEHCALLARPGYGQAAHIHHLEDEALLLLEGEVSGFCGDQHWQATAGSFVFLPRRLVHGWSGGRNPSACLCCSLRQALKVSTKR